MLTVVGVAKMHHAEVRPRSQQILASSPLRTLSS